MCHPDSGPPLALRLRAARAWQRVSVSSPLSPLNDRAHMAHITFKDVPVHPPTLRVIPSTPGAMNGSDDSSQVPQPASPLMLSVEPAVKPPGARFGSSHDRRRAPTLQELSSALRYVYSSSSAPLAYHFRIRLQHPDKFGHLSEVTVSLKEPTASLPESSASDGAPHPTRPRLSASISSATLSRSQSSANSPVISNSLDRCASVADPTELYRGSALPTLAALGARFAARSAGAEQPEAEKALADFVKGAHSMKGEFKNKVAPLSSDRDIAATSTEESNVVARNRLAKSDGFILPPVASSASESVGAVVGAVPMPSIAQLAPTHPLQHPWTFSFQNPRGIVASPASNTAENIVPPVESPTTQAYEAALRVIGAPATTVESFCHLFNWVKKPSQLGVMDSVHFFKVSMPYWVQIYTC